MKQLAAGLVVGILLVPSLGPDLAQALVTSGTAQAVGMVDTNGSVFIRATVSDSGALTCRLELEVRPVGTPFSDVATHMSLFVASGTLIEVPVAVASSSPVQPFHWQARTVNSALAATPWSTFGGNAESEADFICDFRPPQPASLIQHRIPSGSVAGPDPVGIADSNATMEFIATVTDPDGENYTLHVEIQPVGTGFTGTPTTSSPGTTASGLAAFALESAAPINVEGDYHWQARSLNALGYTSDWVSFGGNAETAADFREDAVNPGNLKQYVLQFTGFPAPAGSQDTDAVVVFGATVTDPEGVSAEIQVEVQPVGTAFTVAPNWTSGFAGSGNEGQITASGPTINSEGDYHWQARNVNNTGYISDWVSFGGNAETAADFREDAVDPGALQQALTAGGASVPAGSVDPDGSLELRGTAIDPDGLSYELQVEVQSVGIPFTGVPTATGGFAGSGNAAVLAVSSLAQGGYHWQARLVNNTGYLSNWISFGANPETSADFIVGGTPPVPSALAQSLTSLGGALAAGTLFDSDGTVFLRATVFTASGFGTAGIEVEVQPILTPFSGTPNFSSPFVASGSVAEALVALPSGAYHWQARAASPGFQSAFVSFGGNPESSVDFMVDLAEPTTTVATSGPIGPGYGGSILGTASDATSGVQAVELRIQRTSDGQFWNGATFQAAPAFVAATVTGGNWSYAFGPVEGESYSVSSRATDFAGNVETTLGSATFLFDTIAPASTPTTSGFQTAATYTTIQGTASDATSGVVGVMITIRWVNANLYWNGAAFVAAPVFLPAGGSTSWNYAFAPQSGQTYEIQSRATDAAGNVQSTLGQSQFTYDATGPDSTVQTSGAYTPATWPGAIAGTATTGAGATITLVELEIQRASDGQFWNGAAFQAAPVFMAATGTTSWSLTFAVTIDTFTVLSRATDSTGAVESALGSATILVSTDLPTTTIATAGLFTVASWPGAVSGTASGGSGGIVLVEVEIRRDSDGLYWNGVAWQAGPIFLPATGTAAWSLPFVPAEGQSYTIRARATDGASVVQSPATSAFLALLQAVAGTASDGRAHCKAGAGGAGSVATAWILLLAALVALFRARRA